MKRLLRLLTFPRLVVFLALAAVFVMAARAPLDTDTLWHLRAGQWQVEHRSLLQRDCFSHTRFDQPWINHSWLSQLIIYGAYALSGQVGLAVLTGILAVGAMALIYRLCEGDPIVRAFSIILGSAAAAIFWSARPQMFSFLFSAVVVYLLWLYQKHGIDHLWSIPLVMVLWVNAHGGFAIGFILMVLATLGEGVHWLMEGVPAAPSSSSEARPTYRSVVRLAAIGLVSAAAVSLNPYGPSMLLYPFRTVGIGVLRDFIQEWAAPNFHSAQTWPFIWLLLGTLLITALSSTRLDWRDAVMVGGTAYSALLAARNIATFALVTIPVLACYLDAWLTERRFRLNSSRLPVRGMFLVVNWMLLLLVIGGVTVRIVYEFEPQRLEQAQGDVFPIDAVDFLEDAQPPGPLFNSYNWGGYLVWEARDYPVYVDGRTDLYDDDFLRGYLKAYFAQPGWDMVLDDAGINTVLVEASSPLAQVLYLTDYWSMIYTDDQASLFVRDDPLGGDR
ncbi:MAG: hypothetical protein JXB30_04025 [Anaerolineae bacterium]|nr:hypothetical protein [Anaerolineae bacterium]